MYYMLPTGIYEGLDSKWKRSTHSTWFDNSGKISLVTSENKIASVRILKEEVGETN
jgi:hypothetical protein